VENTERNERLAAELEAMQSLKEESTLFDFESEGDPPTKYIVTFRGKGISRGLMSSDKVETVELHRCEIRLPYSYPDRAPDIRWETPIFHPNISFSGMIKLADVGLPWDKNLSLDVICERLWDIARMAYANLEKTGNYSAKKWFEQNPDIQLPVDNRPLRGTVPLSGSNVIRYERRAGGGVALPGAAGNDDVLFIGEDTPTPEMPKPRPRPRPSRFDDDDDVLYIE